MNIEKINVELNKTKISLQETKNEKCIKLVNKIVNITAELNEIKNALEKSKNEKSINNSNCLLLIDELNAKLNEKLNELTQCKIERGIFEN